MVRLTHDLIAEAPQFINTIRERELSLRDYKIPVIENLGVTGDQFDVIDLSGNDVKKLDQVPLMKRLTCLYLHNNRVQYIQPRLGDRLPNLKTLALTNNDIRELGDIDTLASCKKLEYLSFIGNPITHKPHYRAYVIFKLPSVRVLDFKRIRTAERKEAKKLFKGTKGEQLQTEVGRKSHFKESDLRPVDEGGLSAVEKKKIEAAIASAKSIAEVEYLNQQLAQGKVPEADWRKHMGDRNGVEKSANKNGTAANAGGADFQAEMEEDDDAENNA